MAHGSRNTDRTGAGRRALSYFETDLHAAISRCRYLVDVQPWTDTPPPLKTEVPVDITVALLASYITSAPPVTIFLTRQRRLNSGSYPFAHTVDDRDATVLLHEPNCTGYNAAENIQGRLRTIAGKAWKFEQRYRCQKWEEGTRSLSYLPLMTERFLQPGSQQTA
ncbi:hypothetical protein ANTQUA_LOCUS1139 [Anthophora quadrimaculata]